MYRWAMIALATTVLLAAGCYQATLGDGPGGAGADGGTDVELTPGADADIGPADCESPSTWYLDDDSDGYGDPARPVDACSAPAGYVADASDCDDGDLDVHPAAAELCGDLTDNDCSGADACAISRVAHWGFDIDASDLSGNGNDGALRNGAVISSGAAVFDGVDDYVEVAHDASFAISTGTLAVWFRADSIGAVHGLWSKDSSGFDAGGHLTMTLRPGGNVRLRIQDSAASYILESGPLSAGVDYQAVVTFGAGGLKLYLNGALVATDAYAGGTLGNLEPIAIGANTQVSGDLTVAPISEPLAGTVSDARFYSRALSGTEISELHALTAP